MLAVTMKTAARELPRIAPPEPRDFAREYVARSSPVVLEGLLAQGRFPALERWSTTFLRERYGDEVLTVSRTREGVLAVDKAAGVLQHRARLGDFLGALERGEPAGYLMAPFEELPPALREDAPPPAYCARARMRKSKLWVSAAGTVSPLHRDAPHNLLAQVAGRKTVLLFSPAERGRMYPCSLFSSVPNFSRVDPERPDFERYPRFAGATPLTCVIGPSDVLFIPSGWWHHVRTTEPSISVNFWWAEGRLLALALAAGVFKRIRRISR
jgi:lysine-specific demethylase 8